MLINTRQALHFGVNFVIAPAPAVDGRSLRRFQEALATEGLEFDINNMGAGAGQFQRRNRPLEVRVLHQAPAPVGQLLALAPVPARTLEEFTVDAEGVCAAFLAVWPGPHQVVARDCSIHHLYDVAAEHAFVFLWEQRLKEDPDQLNRFRRSVLGGGLRFFMPPMENEPEPKQIEVKIESYLNDSRKLYVDVACAWPTPAAPAAKMDPRSMLDDVEHYATTEVVAFIQGEG